MLIALALFPIAAALLLMGKFKVSPGKALTGAWLATAAIAALVWKMPLVNIAAASLLGLGKALDIILIIFGAIFLLNILKHVGAFTTINRSFSSISDDRRIQLIIIAWLFAGFIEGTSGFGAAPALAAPLLAGLGFPAITAVAVSLICNSLSVPFGAAGLPTMTIASTLSSSFANSGTDPESFSREMLNIMTLSSGFSGLFIPLCAIAFMIFSSKKDRKLRSLLEITPLAILSAAVYIIPWRYTALYLGMELPSIMGALIGLPIIICCIKFRFLVPKYVWDFPKNEKSSFKDTTLSDTPEIPAYQAWMPYILLALLLLLLRLPFLPFKEMLNCGTLHLPEIFKVPGTNFSWNILNNPGIVPFALLSISSAFLWKIRPQEQIKILNSTLKQIWMASVAVAASIAMVQIMVFSRSNGADMPGMLSCIALGAAEFMGKAYIIGAPFIGIFGTFFAGSCTVSNILFVQLHFDTAQMLKLNEALLIALQDAGAGLGSMIRISGVIAACATVNLKNKETEIILKNCIPALFLALMILLGAYIFF